MATQTSTADKLAERRAAILSAAEKVFDAHGYAATTMEAVAAEAGIAKGSVYNYFASKEVLFQQVFEAAVGQMEAEPLAMLEEAGPASEKLERILDNWFARLSHSKRIGRLMLEFWATAARQEQQTGISATYGRIYARWRERLAALVSRGVSAGEFDPQTDPATAASLILAIMDGTHVQSILDVGLTADDKFFASLKRAIMESLAPKRNMPVRA